MSLPHAWLETLARLGVRLTRDDSWAFCRLEKDGYQINLPPCLDGEEAVVVLRHELQHALAGDCLSDRWPQDVPPETQNVVADAVINASLPVATLEAAASRMAGEPAEVVTLEGLGWQGSYTPGRNELLGWLRRQGKAGRGSDGSQEQQNNGRGRGDGSGKGQDRQQQQQQNGKAGGQGSAERQGSSERQDRQQQQAGSGGQGSPDRQQRRHADGQDKEGRRWGYDPEHPELQHDPTATPEELEQAHREFVERAAKEAGMQAAAQRPLPAGDYVRAAELAATIRTAAQAVEWAAYRVGTWRLPVRTWAREGRTPQLRGQARLPRLRLAVLLDVSGSMKEHLPVMVALAELLRARGEVKVLAFSAEAAEVSSAQDIERIAGGGTVIRPAVELAAGADAAVIITDGEIADARGLDMPWPSVWVLADGGKLPAVHSEWPPVVLPLPGGSQ